MEPEGSYLTHFTLVAGNSHGIVAGCVQGIMNRGIGTEEKCPENEGRQARKEGNLDRNGEGDLFCPLPKRS